MSLTSVFEAIEGTALAEWLRESLLAFPALEAIHVIGLTLVFGTIMIVDLRLLGVASLERAYKVVSGDMLKWTWAAFGLTALTGLLMFSTNARVYADNPFFRAKLVLLALAGINMAIFQLRTHGTHESWGDEKPAPTAGRVAATLSLVLWIAVIVMGRAVGFTLQGAAAKEEPPPAGVNFDDFLGGDSSAPPPSGGPN